MEERIQPIRITDNGTNEVYELDFNRESAVFTDRMFRNAGIKMEEIGDSVNEGIPLFWYCAFRAKHKNVSRAKADEIRNKLGGLTPNITDRLISLYTQATMSNNVVQTEEELSKNSKVTVEL